MPGVTSNSGSLTEKPNLPALSAPAVVSKPQNEFKDEPKARFEWNTKRFFHREEGSTGKSTMGILSVLLIFPIILSLIVDLGRRILFAANLIDGKSWSLYDGLKGACKATATKIRHAVKSIFRPPSFTLEQLNQKSYGAFHKLAKQLVKAYDGLNGGWLHTNASFSSPHAIEAEHEIARLQGSVIEELLGYIQNNMGGSLNGFGSALKNGLFVFGKIIESAAEGHVYVPNKVERKGALPPLGKVIQFEMEKAVEMSHSSPGKASIQQAFINLARQEPDFVDALTTGLEDSVLNKEQAQSALVQQVAQSYEEGIKTGAGLIETLAETKQLLKGAADLGLLDPVQIESIKESLKTLVTPEELGVAAALDVARKELIASEEKIKKAQGKKGAGTGGGAVDGKIDPTQPSSLDAASGAAARVASSGAAASGAVGEKGQNGVTGANGAIATGTTPGSSPVSRIEPFSEEKIQHELAKAAHQLMGEHLLKPSALSQFLTTAKVSLSKAREAASVESVAKRERLRLLESRKISAVQKSVNQSSLLNKFLALLEMISIKQNKLLDLLAKYVALGKKRTQLNKELQKIRETKVLVTGKSMRILDAIKVYYEKLENISKTARPVRRKEEFEKLLQSHGLSQDTINSIHKLQSLEQDLVFIINEEAALSQKMIEQHGDLTKLEGVYKVYKRNHFESLDSTHRAKVKEKEMQVLGTQKELLSQSYDQEVVKNLSFVERMQIPTPKPNAGIESNEQEVEKLVEQYLADLAAAGAKQKHFAQESSGLMSLLGGLFRVIALPVTYPISTLSRWAFS